MLVKKCKVRWSLLVKKWRKVSCAKFFLKVSWNSCWSFRKFAFAISARYEFHLVNWIFIKHSVINMHTEKVILCRVKLSVSWICLLLWSLFKQLFFFALDSHWYQHSLSASDLQQVIVLLCPPKHSSICKQEVALQWLVDYLSHKLTRYCPLFTFKIFNRITVSMLRSFHYLKKRSPSYQSHIVTWIFQMLHNAFVYTSFLYLII